VRDPGREHLHVLIYQNQIAVWIDDHKARRSRRRLIRFGFKRYALCFELALEIADVGEDIKFLRVAVPAGIKSEDVLFEHSLEQANCVIAVFQNQPILGELPGEDFETEFFIELSGSLNVFHG